MAKVEIKTPKVNTTDLNQELTRSIEELSRHLLGEPTVRNADSLRYGRKGSLSFNLETGLWYNFETGEKGNALQLITTQIGFKNFKDTIQYAKDFLNHPDNLPTLSGQSIQGEKIKKGKDTSGLRNYALKLIASSTPIKGTLAERYLKEHRGITQYNNAEFKFVPKMPTKEGKQWRDLPAFMSIARDANNEVSHVHVIRLDPLTGGKNLECGKNPESDPVKQTFGRKNGQPMVLNSKSTSQITYLTEGIETGLSILEGEPEANVYAVTGKGSLKKIDLDRLGERVVLCLDNDGDNTFKNNDINNCVDRLLKSGKQVAITLPNKENTDFNDILRQEGKSGVKMQLAKTIDAETFLRLGAKAFESTEDHIEKIASQELKDFQKLYKDYAVLAVHDSKQLAQWHKAESHEKQQVAIIKDFSPTVNQTPTLSKKIVIEREL
jgi:hypothetical protein